MAGLRTALVKLLAREDREFQRQSIRRIVCSFSSNANRHKVCWLSSKGINISPLGGKREPNAILAQYLNSTGLLMISLPGALALRRTCNLPAGWRRLTRNPRRLHFSSTLPTDPMAARSRQPPPHRRASEAGTNKYPSLHHALPPTCLVPALSSSRDMLARSLLVPTVFAAATRSASAFLPRTASSSTTYASRAYSATAMSAGKPISIIVEADIKPERMDEFLDLIQKNAEGSRKEPGCQRFGESVVTHAMYVPVGWQHGVSYNYTLTLCFPLPIANIHRRPPIAGRPQQVLFLRGLRECMMHVMTYFDRINVYKHILNHALLSS